LKQTSDFRKAFKRRFFVLDSQGMVSAVAAKCMAFGALVLAP
jgi:hypothetical protein